MTYSNKVFGVLLSSLFLILFFFNIIQVYLISFIEAYLSVDHHLEDTTKNSVAIATYTFFSLLLAIYLCTLEKVSNYLINNFYAVIETKKLALFTTDTSSVDIINGKLFILIFTLSLLLLLQFLVFGSPKPEGFIELFFGGLLAVAAFTFAYSILLVFRKVSKPQNFKKLLFSLFTFALISLVFFGEEFSYGQTIFKWNTGAIFSKNHQSETNIHNFLNPMFPYIYSLISILSAIILLLLWGFVKTNLNEIFFLFRPHHHLMPPLFLMSGYGISGKFEEFEALLSLALCLHSVRILIIIKRCSLERYCD